MKNIISKIRSFARGKRGVAIAEYCILLFIVAIGVVVALRGLSSAEQNTINLAATDLGAGS